MSDAIPRAEDAKRLLEHPLLNEVLDGIEAEAISRWRTTRNDDVQTREEYFQTVRANDRLRAGLQAIVNDGKVAAHVAARHAVAQIRPAA